jgi:outer membrane protein TolC
LFLEYLLVDFGRRRADVQRTLFALDAASLRYDRQLQRTIFGVQRSYFAHSAALEEKASARVNRDLARTLVASITVAKIRLKNHASSAQKTVHSVSSAATALYRHG